MSSNPHKKNKSGSKTIKKRHTNTNKVSKRDMPHSSDEDNFEKKKEEIVSTLKEINTLIKKTIIDLKELEMIHKRELKNISKNTKKNSGKQSGFNKPVPVPKSLQKLLILNDDPLAKSHVTKLMYKYIEKNNLYSPKTKKIIIPNKEMRNVFGMKESDIMRFENFQTWLKKVYNEDDELVLDINY